MEAWDTTIHDIVCFLIVYVHVSADCTAWLDWCHTYWTCGTQYEEDIFFAGPIPGCPAPPPNYQPPPQPGTCQFNVSAARCQFMTNSTSEHYRIYHDHNIYYYYSTELVVFCYLAQVMCMAYFYNVM
jgi:hypothetical protein